VAHVSRKALHIFISNRPGAVSPGTSGAVVPGYEARLVDDAGAPVADDEPGHLLVRGDCLVQAPPAGAGAGRPAQDRHREDTARRGP